MTPVPVHINLPRRRSSPQNIPQLQPVLQVLQTYSGRISDVVVSLFDNLLDTEGTSLKKTGTTENRKQVQPEKRTSHEQEEQEIMITGDKAFAEANPDRS